MASQAQLKANSKYHDKFDDIKIRVPKGQREKYKQYAESRGLSLNQIIIKLMNEDMQRNGFELNDSQSNADQSGDTE